MPRQQPDDRAQRLPVTYTSGEVFKCRSCRQRFPGGTRVCVVSARRWLCPACAVDIPPAETAEPEELPFELEL